MINTYDIIKTILTITTDKTICTNQLPYSCNGHTYTTAGTYDVTLTSIAGCDSIATLNLSVNAILTSTTDITICANQLPYSWNGQTYTQAGSYDVTLTSTTGCDSVTTLHLINPVVTGEETITICEATLPYTWNGQNITAAGDYTATLVSAAGCDSIATLHLVVNPVVNIEQTITICE